MNDPYLPFGLDFMGAVIMGTAALLVGTLIKVFFEGYRAVQTELRDNPRFPIANWQAEVANGGTLHGYEEWVEMQIAIADDELPA